MASHMHKTLTALLTLALLPAWAATAPAQESNRQTPIFFWGIQRGAVHDAAIEAAVQQRLQQMGEVVLPMPQSSSTKACSGPACGLALRDSSELTAARVVGGQVDATPNGDWQGKLWWVDVASGKTVSRHWQCRGCNLPNLLSREAAELILAAPAAPADSTDDCAPQIREAPVPASAGPSEPLRTALDGGVHISLTTSGGARVSTPLLTKEVVKSLLQMGIHAATDPSENAGAVASLGIDLAGQPTGRPGAVELITLTLQAQGRERQVRFYCPRESCQTQLPRSLRMNLGVLFDGGEQPVVASLEPMTRCTPNPPPGRRVATMQDPTLLAYGNTPQLVPLVTDKPDVTVQAEDKPCPNPKSRLPLRIAGGILLGGGVVGLIPSGWLASKDGVVVKPLGCDYDYKNVNCILDTRSGYIPGFLVSGAAMITGAILLAVSGRSTESHKARQCVQQ